MEHIAKWFPFTLEEVRAGLLAQGFSPDDADLAAMSIAREFSLLNESEGSFGEYDGGRWLNAIAALSEDAARRVEEFRQRWGPPHSEIWEVVVRGDKQ